MLGNYVLVGFQIQVSQELVKSEKARMEDLRREKQNIQQLLNVKVEVIFFVKYMNDCNFSWHVEFI